MFNSEQQLEPLVEDTNLQNTSISSNESLPLEELSLPSLPEPTLELPLPSPTEPPSPVTTHSDPHASSHEPSHYSVLEPNLTSSPVKLVPELQDKNPPPPPQEQATQLVKDPDIT